MPHANLWTVNPGHDLGTYQESITQSIPLPVVSGCTLTVIIGKLPGGLRISGDNLLGTPFEVKRLKNFRFVIRAVKDTIQEDMTLQLKISGAMCLPPNTKNPSKYFKLMKEICLKYKVHDISMGMSNDYLSAIEYGSTNIRIGSLIFGKRKN